MLDLISPGGAGRNRVMSKKEFVKLKVPLPSVGEQQKIAAFLTAVDNKIEQLSKKQELLGEYKKGLMQQIFSQVIRFKADDGSDFPDWEEKKLGGIGHTFNGLTGKTKDDFGRGKPYIQYMQIFESSKINIDNFGLVDVRDDENQKVAQYGDVFFTTSSETPDAVGYSSVLLDDIDKLYLNSFCFGFRPNSLDELSPNFAQFLLRSANFRRRVVRLAQGSTRYNMSKVQLMKEVISLPCLKEQTKIAIFLSSIDSKIEQVGKQLDESKQFKKALLQQMFV
jgi:type I restriction enzyme S subunit